MTRLTALFYSLLFLFSSCLQSERDVLIQKNNCYSSKLQTLVTDTLYVSVFRQFMDSFETLKRQEKIFQSSENRID